MADCGPWDRTGRCQTCQHQGPCRYPRSMGGSAPEVVPCEHDFVFLRQEQTGPRGLPATPDSIGADKYDIFRCRKCLAVRSVLAAEYRSNGHFISKHVVR